MKRFIRSWSPTHLTHLVVRRLRGRAGVEEVAAKRCNLCPRESEYTPPAVFLPGQLDNVVAVHPQTTRAIEDRRINGAVVEHAPTVAYWLDGARLCDFGVYKGSWSRYLTQNAKSTARGAPARVEGESALVSSLLGGLYFGHWLRDDTAAYLLAAEVGAAPMTTATPDWTHKPFYAAAFGQNWSPTGNADFETLVVFDDYSQNSHKKARYEVLRAGFRNGRRPMQEGARVYLKRGDGGVNRRVLINERALVETLTAEGFIILDVNETPVETVAAALLGARLFVTVEGSQQNHALPALPEGAAYVAIQPPALFNNAARDWTALIGVRYGFVVAKAEGEGFRVDIRALMKTIEIAERG